MEQTSTSFQPVTGRRVQAHKELSDLAETLDSASDEYAISYTPDPTITIEVGGVGPNDYSRIQLKASELKRIVNDLDL